MESWRIGKRGLIACVVLAALFGLVGACVLALVLLLVMPLPVTLAGQAWRLFALGTIGTAAVGAAVGGVVGFALGTSYPPTLPFAVLEGALLVGVPTVVPGLVVGTVLALTHRRRARRTVQG